MKNLIKCLLLIILVSSCSKNYGLKKVEHKYGNSYSLTVKAENPDKSKQDIEFSIDADVVEELRLSEDKIKEMCKIAITNASYRIKCKETYRYGETGRIYWSEGFGNSPGTIDVTIYGTAKKAKVGKTRDVESTVSFDTSGNLHLLGEKKVPAVRTYIGSPGSSNIYIDEDIIDYYIKIN